MRPKGFRLTSRRWKEGFRETFLVRFTRRGDASALRRLVALLLELYDNAAPRWWPRHDEGDLRALLGATVKDIRHLRDVLLWVGEGTQPTPETNALATYASRLYEDLEKIAATLEDALANPERILEEERIRLNIAVGMRPREAVR